MHEDTFVMKLLVFNDREAKNTGMLLPNNPT